MRIDLGDSGDPKVISIEVARRQYTRDECEHRRVIVDKTLSFIKCRDCKDTINPIWWISRLAQDWFRVKSLMKQYRDAKQAYETKKRTKCQHCGRMTRINEPPKMGAVFHPFGA